MTPEAAEALEKCIAKYDRGANGERILLGPEYCDLCKIFRDHNGCNGCPIKESTGMDYCEGVPYRSSLSNIMHSCSHTSNIYKDACEEMRDFLIGLREV